MSYFEDYVEGGLCCESCGEFLGGDEPGFVRYCSGCKPEAQPTQLKKKMPCPTCGKAVKEAGLSDHMRDVHGGEA